VENSQTKQVIIIRKDLKMRRGKEIAQGAHASMKFLAHKIREVKDVKVRSMAGEHFPVFLTPAEEHWLLNKFAKITLKVNSEEELLELHQKALDTGLTSCLVTDSGKTEFNGIPTNTCIAIGPDDIEKINAITGDLKLY
jgi:PTH2 family peptidyl-tRNA hydrolase